MFSPTAVVPQSDLLNLGEKMRHETAQFLADHLSGDHLIHDLAGMVHYPKCRARRPDRDKPDRKRDADS